MKLTLFVSIVVLTSIVSCAPIPSSTETQISPTSTIINSTPTPTSKLQITYVQLKDGKNITEIYAVDITCLSVNKICFDKPKLLFQSLIASDTDQTLPEGYITDYDWSPDGSKIVLKSTTEILIGDINTHEWLNITNTPEDDHAPKWSDDGRFIYYIACLEDPSGMCTPQLIRFDIASKQQLQLLQEWKKTMIDYDISPDGQRIIINAPDGIHDVLYQANWDGTDGYQITTMDVQEFAPSFSPDGKKIAFFRAIVKNSVESKDEWDIIVKDLISGEEKNLTENFDRLAASPVFSPDGKWLAFDARDSELNWDIFLVSLETGEIVQITHGNDETSPEWRWFSE